MTEAECMGVRNSVSLTHSISIFKDQVTVKNVLPYFIESRTREFDIYTMQQKTSIPKSTIVSSILLAARTQVLFTNTVCLPTSVVYKYWSGPVKLILPNSDAA